MILKQLADISVALTDLFHAFKIRRYIAQQTHQIRKVRVLFGLVEDPVEQRIIDCFPVLAIVFFSFSSVSSHFMSPPFPWFL